jgi:membrane protease YdiL (CAAX protease family)
MKKKALYFYGINLIITLIFAMIFGGVLQSIKGNELLLGTIVTVGVQLSLITTTIIYRRKYKVKKEYNYKLDKYILLSIIIPVAIIGLSALVLHLMGNKYVTTEYKGIVLIVALITTLIGSISEEIGWRGTFLPIFEEKYSKFISSLIVGLLWGAWHFFKISSVGPVAYLLFIPSTAMYGVILTYIYNKSNKSLVNPIIFHSFINISSVLLVFNRECIEFYITTFVVSLIILGIIYIFDRKYFK